MIDRQFTPNYTLTACKTMKCIRTWSNHHIRPPKLSAFLPKSHSSSLILILSSFEKTDERSDRGVKLFATFNLGGGILGLEVSVECWDECAVDMVCLETDKSAGI